MFCVDHVECIVGCHKVCRMIVPSVLEVMINLQLSANLSGFVQKYTYTLNSRLSIRAYIALQVRELVWMMSSWCIKAVRIDEDWWTRQSRLVWEEARLLPRCQINVMWARVLLEVPPKGRNLKHPEFLRSSCLLDQRNSVSENKSSETQGMHVLCRSCRLYSGISQGL